MFDEMFERNDKITGLSLRDHILSVEKLKEKIISEGDFPFSAHQLQQFKFVDFFVADYNSGRETWASSADSISWQVRDIKIWVLFFSMEIYVDSDGVVFLGYVALRDSLQVLRKLEEGSDLTFMLLMEEVFHLAPHLFVEMSVKAANAKTHLNLEGVVLFYFWSHVVPNTRLLHASQAKLHPSRDEIYEVFYILFVIHGGRNWQSRMGLHILGDVEYIDNCEIDKVVVDVYRQYFREAASVSKQYFPEIAACFEPHVFDDRLHRVFILDNVVLLVLFGFLRLFMTRIDTVSRYSGEETLFT